MSVKSFKKWIFPQWNIFFSDHKIEIAKMIPYTYAQVPKLKDPYDNRIARMIIAGEIYPSNDANAIGVISNNYDLTYGDVEAAVCTHGFIKENFLPYNLTNEARSALKHITFIQDYDAQQPTITCVEPETFVAGTKYHLHALVSVEDAIFLPLAEYTGGWLVSGASATVIGASLKSDNLIFLTLDVQSCTGEEKDNEIRIKLQAPYTTSKIETNEIAVGDVLPATQENIDLMMKKQMRKRGILINDKIFK